MKVGYKDGVVFFPVINSKGKTVFTKYRDIIKGEPIKNPKGGRTSLYGANLFTVYPQQKRIVLVEGESDMLSFNSRNKGNDAIALTSTSGVMSAKPEWLKYLYQKGYDIIILFDNDKAGDKGRFRL
jgi:DNA primase